jgi:hypothetical protein
MGLSREQCQSLLPAFLTYQRRTAELGADAAAALRTLEEAHQARNGATVLPVMLRLAFWPRAVLGCHPPAFKGHRLCTLMYPVLTWPWNCRASQPTSSNEASGKSCVCLKVSSRWTIVKSRCTSVLLPEL